MFIIFYSMVAIMLSLICLPLIILYIKNLLLNYPKERRVAANRSKTGDNVQIVTISKKRRTYFRCLCLSCGVEFDWLTD